MSPERDSGSNKSGQGKRNLPPDPERGALIRRLMDERGWTEKRLATAVGVGERTVQGWKAGGGMRRTVVAKLADTLEVSPAEIVGPYGDAPLSAEERLASGTLFGERRSGERPMTAGSVLAQLRGDDRDVSLTSLHEDVQSLSGLMRELLDLLHERGELGELAGGEGEAGRSGGSEEEGPAASSP